MSDPSRRVRFLGDLAAVVDDETKANHRHGDLLANNPAAAELRDEVRELAAQVGMAGMDYAPSADFQRKLDEELKARRAGRPHRADSREHTVPVLALPTRSPHMFDIDIDTGPMDTAEIEVIRLDDQGRPIETLAADPAGAPKPPATAAAPDTHHEPATPAGVQRRWRTWVALLLSLAGLLALQTQLSDTDVFAPVEPRKAGRADGNRVLQATATTPVPLATAGDGGPVVLRVATAEGSARDLPARDGYGCDIRSAGGKPIAAAKDVRAGQSVETDGGDLCVLRTLSGVPFVLGRSSRLTVNQSGEYSLLGDLAIGRDDSPNAGAVRVDTPQGQFRWQGGRLLLRATALRTHGATLVTPTTLLTKQGDHENIPAPSTFVVPLRGTPKVRRQLDPSAWLPLFWPREEGFGLGQLLTPGQLRASHPAAHHLQVTMGAGHAQVQVQERFLAEAHNEPRHYSLCLPAGASLLSVTVADVQNGARPGAPPAALHGDHGPCVLATVQGSAAGHTVTTRYLQPLSHDALGAHLNYGLRPWASRSTTVTIDARWHGLGTVSILPEHGRLAAESAPERSSLVGTVDRPWALRLQAQPQTPETDGTVLWSTWDRASHAGARTGLDPDFGTIGVAVRVAPSDGLPATPGPATTSPRPTSRRVLLVVDRSTSTTDAQLDRISLLLDQLLQGTDPDLQLTVLACDLACRTLVDQGRADPARVRHALHGLAATPPAGGPLLLASVLASARHWLNAQPNTQSNTQLEVAVATDAAILGHRPASLASAMRALAPDARLSMLLLDGTTRQPLVAQLAARAGGRVVPISTMHEAQLAGMALAIQATLPHSRITHVDIQDRRGRTTRLPTQVLTSRTGWLLVPGQLADGGVALVSGATDKTPWSQRYFLGHMPGQPTHPVVAALRGETLQAQATVQKAIQDASGFTVRGGDTGANLVAATQATFGRPVFVPSTANAMAAGPTAADGGTGPTGSATGRAPTDWQARTDFARDAIEAYNRRAPPRRPRAGAPRGAVNATGQARVVFAPGPMPWAGQPPRSGTPKGSIAAAHTGTSVAVAAGAATASQQKPATPMACRASATTTCLQGLQQLAAERPARRAAHLRLATAYLRAGRAPDAWHALSAAADLWNLDAGLHATAGQGLFELGETELACAHLRIAARLWGQTHDHLPRRCRAAHASGLSVNRQPTAQAVWPIKPPSPARTPGVADAPKQPAMTVSVTWPAGTDGELILTDHRGESWSVMGATDGSRVRLHRQGRTLRLTVPRPAPGVYLAELLWSPATKTRRAQFAQLAIDVGGKKRLSRIRLKSKTQPFAAVVIAAPQPPLDPQVRDELDRR